MNIVIFIIFCILHILEFSIYLPQISKLMQTKSSNDISISSQVINLIMNVLWFIYWILTKVTWIQLCISFVILIEVLLQFILVVKYHKWVSLNNL